MTRPVALVRPDSISVAWLSTSPKARPSPAQWLSIDRRSSALRSPTSSSPSTNSRSHEIGRQPPGRGVRRVRAARDSSRSAMTLRMVAGDSAIRQQPRQRARADGVAVFEERFDDRRKDHARAFVELVDHRGFAGVVLEGAGGTNVRRASECRHAAGERQRRRGRSTVRETARFAGAAFLKAQFVNGRHRDRMSPDSPWRSDRWITSGFGIGSRVSMS